MDEKKISEILDVLLGLRFHEWKSIEALVNQEFDEMSNRLVLTDVSKIQKKAIDEIIR